MDKPVEIVENLSFSTTISLPCFLWEPVERSVDNVDKPPVIHRWALITSPVCTREIPVKKSLPVGFCHLFGEVG